MRRLGLGLPLAAGLLVGLAGQAAFAEDGEIKVGVVAAESGSFVSAGNTIAAAANTSQAIDTGAQYDASHAIRCRASTMVAGRHAQSTARLSAANAPADAPARRAPTPSPIQRKIPAIAITASIVSDAARAAGYPIIDGPRHR